MKKTVFIFGMRRWLSFLAWSDDLGWLGYVRLSKSFVYRAWFAFCIPLFFVFFFFFKLEAKIRIKFKFIYFFFYRYCIIPINNARVIYETLKR